MASTSSQQLRTVRVALVGNPNSGKSSLFNALTGASQKVGNYPGVTVEKVSGRRRLGDAELIIDDLPGIYSLTPQSADERAAVDALRDPKSAPDVLVYVVDAANLERNLYLLHQLIPLRIPMVLALTMTDTLEGVDGTQAAKRLERSTGIPTVSVVSHKKSGIDDLSAKILEVAAAGPEAVPLTPQQLAIMESLTERLARAGFEVSMAEVRSLLRGQNELLADSLLRTPELYEAVANARSELLLTESANSAPAARYEWAEKVAREVELGEAATRRSLITKRIDAVLTHSFWGLVIFVLLMYGVFQSLYTLATPLMDLIDGTMAWLGESVSETFATIPWLQSLVVDGVIAGVGAVLVFLPQIIILFFFIAILEGTGYMARAAFLMDRLFSWCGLNGRAFIPLLSSYACAIPGIMSARVMPDEKSRLATILIAPMMSCSARLPVYLLFIGAFIEPLYGPGWAGFALFAMHFVGLIVAIPVALLITRRLLKGSSPPFILELPSYQWPKWKEVGLTMFFRARVFVVSAGTIILTMSVVIWALLYFPRSEAQIASYEREFAALEVAGEAVGEMESFVDARLVENSILGTVGHTLAPVFYPAGFDWRLTTSILAAFPARELAVSSLGIIFSLGGDQNEESPDLRRALKSATWPDGSPLLTVASATAMMVFFALCCQCMATLAVIKRETNSWKWPTFVFVYMTVLAYVAAVVIFQLLRWVGL
jgi:ferrous iron transport protein B